MRSTGPAELHAASGDLMHVKVLMIGPLPVAGSLRPFSSQEACDGERGAR